MPKNLVATAAFFAFEQHGFRIEVSETFCVYLFVFLLFFSLSFTFTFHFILICTCPSSWQSRPNNYLNVLIVLQSLFYFIYSAFYEFYKNPSFFFLFASISTFTPEPSLNCLNQQQSAQQAEPFKHLDLKLKTALHIVLLHQYF